MSPHEIKNLLYNKEIFNKVERLTKKSQQNAEKLWGKHLAED